MSTLVDCPYCNNGKNKNKRAYILNNVFYCHNCGKNIPLSLYYKEQGYDVDLPTINIPENTKKEYIPSSLIEKYCSPLTEEAKNYLLGRGITEEYFDRFLYSENIDELHCKLHNLVVDRKYIKDKRICIKFEDENGILGLKCRDLNPDSKLRYRFVKKGDSSLIYNLNNVDTNRKVMIVEGEFDAMILQQFYDNVIALGSLAKCYSNELNVISRENRFYFLDNDKPGKQKVWDMVNDLDKNYKCFNWKRLSKYYDLSNVKDITDLYKIYGRDVLIKVLDKIHLFEVDFSNLIQMV